MGCPSWLFRRIFDWNMLKYPVAIPGLRWMVFMCGFSSSLRCGIHKNVWAFVNTTNLVNHFVNLLLMGFFMGFPPQKTSMEIYRTSNIAALNHDLRFPAQTYQSIWVTNLNFSKKKKNSMFPPNFEAQPYTSKTTKEVSCSFAPTAAAAKNKNVI